MAIEDTPPIPEERRFVWRNIEAYLAGELNEADRKRIESYLCDCEYTREFVECEQTLTDAVKRCVNDIPAPCPDSLRLRVLEALDRCELEECPPAGGASPHVARFPWPGVALLAAACVMLAVALVMLTNSEPEQPGLYAGLQPLVMQVGLDSPVSETCRMPLADAEYRKYFADAPALPTRLDGSRVKVSSFECVEVEGRRVMAAVYDAADGERFGLLVFSCDCLDESIVGNMQAAELQAAELQAAELQVGDKHVLLWRDGEFYRVLVGRDALKLRRHMNELRGAL